MNKLKQTVWLLKLFLITIFLFSCSENEILTNSNDFQQNKNFVSLSKIEDIVKNLKHPIKDNNLKSKGVMFSSKTIENTTEIPDENGNTSYYVINYTEGGFILLSADNRINPILAYSEYNSFSINYDEYPSGLVEWLFNTKERVKSVRSSNKEQSKEAKKAWKEDQIQFVINRVIPDDGNNCEDNLEIVDPLLSTEWHQRCGFNTYMPTLTTLNCSNYLPCGRAYAGCVPIAMAQIMKYHNYPTNYNWSNMPNTSGTTTTANFIKDIHNVIGNSLTYKCKSTVVGSSANMATILKNSFNYSSANKADYNYNTVINELRNNRPVILSGGTETGWWIFASYSGHMWVCDGFREHKICMFDNNGNLIGANTYLFLNMNWGWGGLYNGLYGFNNFNPGSKIYNDRKKMIYNIKP